MEHLVDTAVEKLNNHLVLRLMFIVGAVVGGVATIAGGFYGAYAFIRWAGNLGF